MHACMAKPGKEGLHSAQHLPVAPRLLLRIYKSTEQQTPCAAPAAAAAAACKAFTAPLLLLLLCVLP